MLFKNFTLSFLLQKKLALLFAFSFILFSNVFSATTYYWVGGSGTWGTSASFATSSGGTGSALSPGSSDVVVFDQSSGNPTVTVTGLAISLAQIQLNTTGAAVSVTLSGAAASSTITLSGNLTISTSCTLTDNSGNTIAVGGGLLGSGTYTGTGKISMTGSVGKSLTGNITVSNLEVNNSGGLTLAASPTITGTLTLTTGTLTVGTNTLALNGGAIAGTATNLATTSSSLLSFGGSNAGPLSIPSSVTALSSLTINNTNTTPATITVNSAISIAGNLTLTKGTLADNGNTISVGGNISGASGGFHSGSGKISMTGNGTSLAGANIVFGNLEIAAGTSGSPITLTSNATLAASKTFTVTSSGYLSMGTNVISFNGASGTVNISGSVLETKQVGFTGAATTSFSSTNNPTVNFLTGSTAIYGANNATQTPSAGTYYNLYITGTRNGASGYGVVLTGAFTINGNFTIDATISGFPTGSFQSPASTTTWTFGGSSQSINFSNTAASSGASTITFGNIAINSTALSSNVDIPLAGNLSGTGSFTAASNKLNMNGATGKTISGLTISNLGLNVNTTLSGSPTITGTLTLTAGALTMTGQTLTMGASGTLNRVAGTLGSAPVYGTGTSVTYSGSGATSANELTPSAGNIGTLTIGGSGTYTLATSLNPTIATLALTSGTLADAGNTITLTGNITGTGTHSGSGKISMTGSGATISAVTTLGNLEIAPGPNNTITASGNVPISGTLTLTSGTIADGGNTITVSGSVFGSGKHTGSGKISMNGSARNIGSVTLQNLELNNAGGFTCTGNPIINGTLTLTAGTLSVATRTLTLNGPAIAGTATNLSTTSSSILSFGGTSSTLSIPSSVVALSSLILNNSNATLTANSAITISGVLALTSGILADGGNILYVGSNITGTGTHTGAGEISMTGSGATISGVTVQNIELNNSGGFSLSGSPTVNGTLTLTTGTLTVGANTLNLNGAAIAGTATNLTTTSSSNLSFGGTNAGPLAIPSSITALNNLTLNNTNGTPATLNANSGITLSGSLALTSGTFADGGNTISVTGNITGTGRHTGAGKISMTGSGKTISGAILQNIEIVPGTGNSISLSGAPTINGVLTLTSGTLTTGANNLSLGGSASATIAPNAKLNASGGTTNFNTRPVTVQSTSAGDGSILPAGGTFSGATNVTLQRYHAQNQRAWRLLSNPLNQSISWATLAGSSTTPFDLTGTGSNASGETYDPASNAFVGYSSTSDAIAATSAYTVFIRGISGQGINADRTYSSSGAPSNVTIGVSGTLNTASVNMIVTAGNYYLIPNPFAAPISVYSFMHSGSNGSYINTSAIYYWDASLGSSDVKVIAGGYGNPSLISAAAPGDANDYIIPMMGAFFVYASGSGTITIPTSAVYTGSFTNKLPYGTGTQNNHIGLTVLRDTKAYDYLNIYLNDQAKASSTDKLDFEKMNNTNLSFYSISSDNKNLSIDERALTTEAIPLGIKTNIQSQFTIKVDGLNTPAGTEIFLTDNLLGTSTALSEGTTYSFTVTADSLTQGNKRFELSYKAKTAIAAPIDNTSNTGVSVYPNPANDYVMINTSTAADINIYDSKGVLMRTEKSAAGNTVKIRTGNWSGGMYVLHINDGQKTVIKKIIIH